jgi:hypothetical protein
MLLYCYAGNTIPNGNQQESSSMTVEINFTADEAPALGGISLFAAAPATFDRDAVEAVAGPKGFTVLDKLVDVGLATQWSDGRYSIEPQVAALGKETSNEDLIFTNNPKPVTMEYDRKTGTITLSEGKNVEKAIEQARQQTTNYFDNVTIEDHCPSQPVTPTPTGPKQSQSQTVDASRRASQLRNTATSVGVTDQDLANAINRKYNLPPENAWSAESVQHTFDMAKQHPDVPTLQANLKEIGEVAEAAVQEQLGKYHGWEKLEKITAGNKSLTNEQKANARMSAAGNAGLDVSTARHLMSGGDHLRA